MQINGKNYSVLEMIAVALVVTVLVGIVINLLR